MNSVVKKRYFTAEEANQRLPLVRAIVSDIVTLFREVHERRERLARVRQLPGSARRNEDTPYAEELQQIEDELEKDISRLEEYVNELRELGVELKDFMVGLVDFPALMDGREVYLCWKLGEEEVAYWHELDAGYRGRQPLFESSLSGDEPAETDEETN